MLTNGWDNSVSEAMKNQDQQLVASIIDGDKRAIREWYQSHSAYLTMVAGQRISNYKDVEEVVQQTFINCLKNIQCFKGRSKLRTWMLSILHHEIADYYRKKYAKKALNTVPLIDELTIKQVKGSQETAQIVKSVLSKMAKKRQELLKLKYIDKKRVKDIAKSLGASVKAIESEIYRARMEFKELYKMVKTHGESI